MSNLSTILTNVMKEYLEIDDELVKNIRFEKGKDLSFVVDMIDDELAVKAEILGGNNYLVSHGNIKNKKVTAPSFKKFLKDLMNELVKEREKMIEFYSNMDSPDPDGSPFSSAQPTPSTPADFEEDGEESDDDDEEEGEDLILEVKKGDMGDMQTLGGLMDDGSDLQNMKLLREAPYEVLTPRQLIEMQLASVKKISENLFVSSAGSNIILRAYRWNEEKILNKFLKSGKDLVLRDVGLRSNRLFNRTAGQGQEEEEDDWKTGKKKKYFECPSCYDDVLFTNTLMLDSCGHRFCKGCWEEHLTIKIEDGLSKKILCMGGSCKCAVDENIVSQFITDPFLKKKYDTKILESFVEDNEKLKWCQSAPHCGNAAMVRVSHETPLEVHCPCDKTFCFACLEEAHNPSSCLMLQAWKKKCSDDSETLNWIKGNTRECPYCHKTVEKNGGCNHISCTCGKHWCWACGGKMEGSHDCNRYKENADPDGQSNSRASLERYLHYFNHYNAHHSSFKNQKKMEKKVNHKIRRMYQSRPNSAWVEVEWLTRALNILFDTRRALMYSYVFAYYLFDKAAGKLFKKRKILKGCRKFRSEKERLMSKNLFEDTQEQLELTTEKLNKFLDLSLEKILTNYTKKEIMSLSVLNEKRVHGLFDVIREEMVVEGEYKLPDPRFIITTPSHLSNMSITGAGKDSGATGKRFQPGGKSQEDVALQRAIQASLMDQEKSLGIEQEDSMLQQVLMRSLQDK